MAEPEVRRRCEETCEATNLTPRPQKKARVASSTHDEPPAPKTAAFATTHSPPGGQQHGPTVPEALVSPMNGMPTPPTSSHITEKAAAVAAVNEQQVDTEPEECVAAELTIDTTAVAAEDTAGTAETPPPQRSDCSDSRSMYCVVTDPPVPGKIVASGDDQHDATEDSCGQFESLVHAVDRCEMLRREVESATAQAGAFHRMLALPCATPGPWLDYLNRHLKTAYNLRKDMHAKLEAEFKTVQTELRAVNAAGQEIGGVVKEKLQRLTEARSAMATPVGLAVSMGLPRLAVKSFGPGQIQMDGPSIPAEHPAGEIQMDKPRVEREGQKILGYYSPEEEEAADRVGRLLRRSKAHGVKTKPSLPAAAAASESAATPHSDYVGVCWYLKRSKWRVLLEHDGQQHHVGYFGPEEEEAAACAYDTAARRLRGPQAHSTNFKLNFPTAKEKAKLAQSPPLGSDFIGVTWYKVSSKWKAQIYVPHEGRNVHIGYFVDEEAAARAYDDEARRLRGSEAHSSKFKLNFPTVKEKSNCPAVSNTAQLAQSLPPRSRNKPNKMLKQPHQIRPQHAAASESQASPSSDYIGVWWHSKRSEWKVSIKHEGKHQYIGSFDLEEEEQAARAYDTAARRLRGPAAHSAKFKLNFPTASELMSSRYAGVMWDKRDSKWVVNITHKRQREHIGYFAPEQEEAAARAYDAAARRLRGPEAHSAKSHKLNFPAAEETMNRPAVSNTAKLAQPTASELMSSQYIGVRWNKKDSKWVASITHKGQKKHIGTFAAEDEEAAAQAYDAAARRLRGQAAHSSKVKLNFPTTEEEMKRIATGDKAGLSQRKFIGLKRSKSGGWEVKISHEGQEQHIGTFAPDQKEAAARAYDDAVWKLRGSEAQGSHIKLNFPRPEESTVGELPETILDELDEIDALSNEEAQVDRQLVKLQQTMSQMPADPANAADAWMTHEDICQVRKRIFCAILH